MSSPRFDLLRLRPIGAALLLGIALGCSKDEPKTAPSAALPLQGDTPVPTAEASPNVSEGTTPSATATKPAAALAVAPVAPKTTAASTPSAPRAASASALPAPAPATDVTGLLAEINRVCRDPAGYADALAA